MMVYLEMSEDDLKMLRAALFVYRKKETEGHPARPILAVAIEQLDSQLYPKEGV